jgi:hypothetical protein
MLHAGGSTSICVHTKVYNDPVNIHDLAELGPWEWPRNAAAVLKAGLRDGHAPEADRIQAIKLAGDLVVIDDEIADLLTGIVSNSSEAEAVRAKAAISLGPAIEQMDIDPEDGPISEEAFERAMSALHSMYQDETAPKLARRYALEASVRGEAEWHADAIRAAWTGSDGEWKVTAVFAMSYVPGFEKEIIEALGSPNEDIRRLAVSAAGERELKGAWPNIEPLLRNKKTPKDLLLPAIAAAACVNPSAAVPLLEELASSKDEEIAEAADEALMDAELVDSFDEDDEDWGEDDEEDEEE